MDATLIVGLVVAGVLVMFGKQVAEWAIGVLGAAIADAIGDQLEPRWRRSVSNEMTEALGPIHEELQIEQGAAKWPNGSSTLPSAMSEIYTRQADTHRAVCELQKQVEAVLTDGTSKGE